MIHSVVMSKCDGENEYRYHSVESSVMNSINTLLHSDNYRYEGEYLITEYQNNQPTRKVRVIIKGDFINIEEVARPVSNCSIHISKSKTQINEMIAISLGVDPDGFNFKQYSNPTEECFYKLTHLYFIDVRFGADGSIKLPFHLMTLIHEQLSRGDLKFRRELNEKGISSELDLTNGCIKFTFTGKYGKLTGKSFLIRRI